MRESIQFLKAYFIFAGVLSGFITYADLPEPQENIIGFIFRLVGIGFSITWVYVGISFRKLLTQAPEVITTLLLVQMALLILGFLMSLANGLQTDPVVYLVVGLMINCYLFYNVRCLVAEERSKKENQ